MSFPFSTAKLLLCLLVIAVMMTLFSGHPTAQVAPAIAVRGGDVPGPLPVFPADNWWNQDISGAPVDPQSGQFIGYIGASRGLHPDFGSYDLDDPAYIYGFPYVVVGADQPKVAVEFYYAAQSDGVTHPGDQSFPFYPIPEEAKTQSYWIESGPPGQADPGGDRHMLILDRDNRHLYELFDLHWDQAAGRWTGGSGAFFDLNRNDRRPDTWTSADAAGLAIFPGLVRYDEVVGADEIRHAFRVTVQSTNGYVWPASHRAGSTGGALPMGARMRLKASKDLSGFHPAMQKVFRAMQRYGLVVADNGTNMYISGTFDTRWDNDILNPAFGALKASDFEIVQLGWGGASTPCAAPDAPRTVAASVSGAHVTLSWSAPVNGGAQSYIVEGGTQPGAANLGSFTVASTPTTLGFDAPPGTYFMRLRARSACGAASAASNEVQIAVPAAGCELPGAAAQPAASVNGSTVTLSWNALAGVTSYLLEAGSAPSLADLLRVPIAGTSIVGTAPPGTYYVRVRGQNACGTGPASPDRTVLVGGGCAPPAPAGALTSNVSGNTVTVQWPAMAGATAYRIEAGSAPGQSNVAAADLTTTVVSAQAPPGTYYIRVHGTNACGGIGPATNEVTVHVQ